MNNNIELCWFLSKSKCQYRLRETSREDISKDNIRHWEKNKLKNLDVCGVGQVQGISMLFPQKRIYQLKNNQNYQKILVY